MTRQVAAGSYLLDACVGKPLWFADSPFSHESWLANMVDSALGRTAECRL